MNNDLNSEQAKPQYVLTSESIGINLSQRLIRFMFRCVVLAIVALPAIVIPGCASALHVAAERNDVIQIRSLLNEGIDIDTRNNNGETPLHVAARKGHLKVVELLLTKGAELDARNKYSMTPTHRAAYAGHVEVVKLLLSKGADVNAKGNNAITPLYFAAQQGNIDIAELFLANGADVDVKDKRGLTPLFAAALNGHQEVAEFLLANGANANAKNDEGWTPLYPAAQEGHIEMMKLLFANGADANEKDKNSQTPLHLQGYIANVAVVELLLANGADVNAKDNSGRTPLDRAAKYKKDAIVDLLIEKGAKRDKMLILPFADCPDAPGSGKAFTNVLYSTLVEELKWRYDMIDISVIEQAFSEIGQKIPSRTTARVQDEVAKRFNADLIVTGELTTWKHGSWTEMPIVGFMVRCRSVDTSTVLWAISHSDSVWLAAAERRKAEIAAGEAIKKAIKEGKI